MQAAAASFFIISKVSDIFYPTFIPLAFFQPSKFNPLLISLLQIIPNCFISNFKINNFCATHLKTKIDFIYSIDYFLPTLQWIF